MSWPVSWTPPAQRDMARLPGKVAGAVVTFADRRLAADPYRLSKPLTGDLAGKRTAPNGDYRVLLRLDDDPPMLWIVHVDHRSAVYRPR